MMKRFYKKFLCKYVEDSRYIFGVYVLVAVFSAISKFLGGKYNNYLIFKNVFTNTVLQQNLYGYYPEIHSDSNHYGILFSIIIAPFAVLPDWLGMILWNIANVFIFIYAIKQLPIPEKMKAFFAWLCLQELITALVSFQFNVALTGLIILSACFIYRKKESFSAISILIGTFVKIYGIVGLSSFFFIRNKQKFLISFAIFSVVFFCIPMIYSSVDFCISSYTDWYTSLIDKNQSNLVLGNMQDISLMGFIRRILGNANISNMVFIFIGLPIFALPYLRIKQYKHRAFQMLILASTLIFMVLFSSGSESPTYIIAVSGVMIWFLIQKKVDKFSLFLLFFVMILTCFGMSDLFPRFVKQNYIIKYSLKALPCAIVWFRIIYELLTRDFGKDYEVIQN